MENVNLEVHNNGKLQNNTKCTYALKQDHAGFTGFYTHNCAIVLLVLVYENVRFRSYFIFTMDGCARAFHNSLANWVF